MQQECIKDRSYEEALEAGLKEGLKLLASKTFCIIVPCIHCDTPFRWKESPEGCCECGMLEWERAYETVYDRITNYKKQNPESFDVDGDFIENK